jgi:hypothetical protein
MGNLLFHNLIFSYSYRMNHKYYLIRKFWAENQIESACMRRETGEISKLYQYDEIKYKILNGYLTSKF